MGTVPSPVAAWIAAAGYLHPSAAARHQLLPPRGGRAERRLKRPGTPSRTGRASGPGSAAGPAHGAAGERAGLGGGRPGPGAEAEHGGWTRGGKRLALGAPRRRAWPPPPPPPRERLPSATPRSGRRGAPRAHGVPWRRAAAPAGYVGSWARLERRCRGARAGAFRKGPREARRVQSSALAAASAPTPRPDAWRPHPRPPRATPLPPLHTRHPPRAAHARRSGRHGCRLLPLGLGQPPVGKAGSGAAQEQAHPATRAPAGPGEQATAPVLPLGHPVLWGPWGAAATLGRKTRGCLILSLLMPLFSFPFLFLSFFSFSL